MVNESHYLQLVPVWTHFYFSRVF